MRSHVVMGKVVSSYGVRGWLKIQVYTTSVEALLSYPQWTLRHGQNEQTYHLIEGHKQDKYLVASLDGVADRETAAVLRGALIVVARSALPELAAGEVYFADLIGLRVIDRDGALLGMIDDVREYGAQAVLHVKPSDGTVEILIPFVDKYIDAVELDDARIRVDWQQDD
ncbi:MAG: ribosome maturation factor RimM [Burkholderiales bacterium]|jgi:16S rRNA processing protein RimM|nr:ribosome maturation factor RimM [Burkholderiales bacterium]